MKHLFKSLGIIGGAILALSSCKTEKKETTAKVADERPNIVVLLCDDLGYADVGFNGAKDIQTPALDNLAENGTVFSSAYVVHPFCGPSRAGLMTGRYPHKYGAQFNLPLNFEDKGFGVPVEETFMAKVLQDAGYFTGAVGKWHLGITAPFHPNKRGFDEFYGFLGGGHQYFPEKYRPVYERRKAKSDKPVHEYFLPLEHNGVEQHETEYITDALSREGSNFIKKAAKKDNPFFLYLAYNAPHSPMQAKKEDMALYADIEDPKRRTYAAMVHAVDRGVSNVVKTLKETGEYDNTLIVFLSDNGGKLKFHASNYPLTGEKGCTTEGGYRTPMFFHWPKGIAKGKVVDSPITALDFYPTFAGLAKATLPANKKLDGKDIYADLQAGKELHKGEYIYAMRHREGFTDVGARKDNWKITRTQNKPWRLYDITKDISEKNDVSAEHPEILKEMVTHTKEWSGTHTQPKWFHDTPTGVHWREMKMPHFEETFSL